MIQAVLNMVLVFLAFGGFLLAFFINHKKKSNEPLVCPLKAHCDTVIHSDYSKIFGIPVEKLGMTYYGFIALSYGFIMIFPALYMPLIASGLLFATLCAFTFSIYLTLVQAFAIKSWCTWCLISAAICLSIFAIAASNSPLFYSLFSNIILSL